MSFWAWILQIKCCEKHKKSNKLQFDRKLDFRVFLDNAKNDFAVLPHEIKVKICSYLDIVSLTNLIKASTCFESIGCDKILLRSINLYKQYKLTSQHINTFLISVRSELITSLNITSFYWISEADLENMLRKLPSLKQLYAADTRLCYIPTQNFIYNYLPNLETLSLTCSLKHIPNLPSTVKKLLLLADNCEICLNSFDSIQKLKLQELWIVNLGPDQNFEIIVKQCLCIKKLVLTSDCLDFYPENLYGRHMTFRRNTPEYQICIELTDGEIFDLYKDSFSNYPNWYKFISKTKYKILMGMPEARKLSFKETTIDKLQFEDLNISHSSFERNCCTSYIQLIPDILITPNMRNLKKLSINVCLCALSKQEKTMDMPILECLVQNSPLIENLEIWGCDGDTMEMYLNDSVLSCLQKLKLLYELTLINVPMCVTGTFLSYVSKSCTYLKTLRISIFGRDNEIFFKNLCKALRYANALKNLTIHANSINFPKLLFLLNTAKLNLERFFLECNHLINFSEKQFEIFVRTNQQLIMFGFIIPLNTERIIILKDIWSKYHNQPQQIFFFGTYEYKLIPYVHKQFVNESHIGVLNILSNFK